MIESQALPTHLNETSKPILPKVIYDKRLFEPGVPYIVHFDAQIFADLLRECGMPDKKIQGLRINLNRKSLMNFGQDFGQYNAITNSIDLYMDMGWDNYQKYLDRAESIIAGKTQPKKNSFKGILTTKRMAEYLTKAPPERAKAFAERERVISCNK